MNPILEYYAGYDEESRLFNTKQHLCEYLLTLHLLRKYIRPDGLEVLDCCAGTGVYAFALASEGALVTAGDLVPEHEAKMRANPKAGTLKEIYTGSALDLSRFDDGQFGAVLCMGALYHMPASEREQCVRECLRVLRPGGVLALAWHSDWALMMGQHFHALRQLESSARRDAFRALDEVVQTHRRGVFYGMSYDEIEALAGSCGLERICNASVYPALYGQFDAAERFSDEEFARYLECLMDTCEDEMVARYGMHGLYLGRKR